MRWLQSLLKPLQGEFALWFYASDWQQYLDYVKQQTPLCCVIHKPDPEAWQQSLRDLAQVFKAASWPLVMIHQADQAVRPDGVEFECMAAKALNSFSLFGAITRALKAYELIGTARSLHLDPLTGLVTRELLVNRLEQSLLRCNRYSERCALLCINVNQFKSVNEKFGHLAGDWLLREVSLRIQANCRSTDSVARLNGDEFVVLIENADKNIGRKVAAKIQAALSLAYDFKQQTIHVTFSMGMAGYPDTARSALELLTQAGQALSKAKSDVNMRFVSFSEQHKSQLYRRNTLELALSRAIDNNDLKLVYQPIVDAKTFEVRRLEALSRWPREDFEVPAQELIDMIDRMNLNEAFHIWLFETAFGQLQAWQRESISPDICLNIPANYCYSNTVAQGVVQAIRRFSIPPEKVELEITESTLMRYPERSIRVLQQLHNERIRIAVDDFGTGFSCMSYLTSLPLDTLKIDRDFFLTKEHRGRNRKVIEAITALGHSLELEIIAEGVETQRELDLARDVGCDLLQGYYFGRPRPAGDTWAEFIGAFEHISNKYPGLKADG